jgi:hypothetical protein
MQLKTMRMIVGLAGFAFAVSAGAALSPDGKDPLYATEKSRLHCTWRRSNPVEGGPHNLLEARGRGHYVGNVLQVHTKWGGWWGEGDAIFHLDEKTITHTPGTEDEYGACWGFEHT